MVPLFSAQPAQLQGGLRVQGTPLPLGILDTECRVLESTPGANIHARIHAGFPERHPQVQLSSWFTLCLTPPCSLISCQYRLVQVLIPVGPVTRPR